MLGVGTVAIGDKQWAVSVATDPEDLAQGLAGIASMPANVGMLFDLATEQIITVTAVDMLFPIDVIFVGSNLEVTEVAYGLAPGDWGTSSLPARYFLEVNAGEGVSIEDGDTAVIQTGLAGTPPISAAPPGAIDLSSVFNMMIVMLVLVMMMKMMTGITEPAKPRMLGEGKLPRGYVPIRHSIHGPERKRLVDQYGSWSVGRAESVCPEDDVACVERESARLLQAYRGGFGA